MAGQNLLAPVGSNDLFGPNASPFPGATGPAGIGSPQGVVKAPYDPNMQRPGYGPVGTNGLRQGSVPDWMNPDLVIWNPATSSFVPQSQIDPFQANINAGLRRSYLANLASMQQQKGNTQVPGGPPVAGGQLATTTGTTNSGGSGYVNPVVRAALQNTFNQVSGLVNQPLQQGLQTITKNQGQADLIAGDQAQFGGDVAAGKNQSLTDFVKESLATRPQATADLDQESGAINQVFDPNGLQKDLAGLSGQRTALLRQAAQQAIARASRSNNLSRMTGGNSSYLDRAYAQSLGNILTNQAVQGNAQDQANLQYLTNTRLGAAGQRQGLLNQYLQSGLMPYQAINQAQAGDLSNIGTIGGLENQNTYYNYIDPNQAVANRMGLIGTLNDLAPSVYPTTNGYARPYYPTPNRISVGPQNALTRLR